MAITLTRPTPLSTGAGLGGSFLRGWLQAQLIRRQEQDAETQWRRQAEWQERMAREAREANQAFAVQQAEQQRAWAQQEAESRAQAAEAERRRRFGYAVPGQAVPVLGGAVNPLAVPSPVGLGVTAPTWQLGEEAQAALALGAMQGQQRLQAEQEKAAWELAARQKAHARYQSDEDAFAKELRAGTIDQEEYERRRASNFSRLQVELGQAVSRMAGPGPGAGAGATPRPGADIAIREKADRVAREQMESWLQQRGFLKRSVYGTGFEYATPRDLSQSRAALVWDAQAYIGNETSPDVIHAIVQQLQSILDMTSMVQVRAAAERRLAELRGQPQPPQPAAPALAPQSADERKNRVRERAQTLRDLGLSSQEIAERLNREGL